ncbi:hypothetical protein ILUMI_24389 [Ignelater luminosus]|uniref:RNA-directed DNA polymerase n=1 Tax=Ignelater luminosus TaxID=2038154 RepID=A0A8K0C987_IGNLU|nr:hypothetical protein ILUMI_24389 [Ignelater luminosus]
MDSANPNPSAPPESFNGDIPDEHDTITSEFLQISLSELFKFIPTFSGDRDEISCFISKVGSAFSITSSNQKPILLKFVLSQITDRLRGAKLSTLNEAIILALAEEASLRMINFKLSSSSPSSNKSSAPPRFCHNCKTNTHNTDKCYRNKVILGVTTSSPQMQTISTTNQSPAIPNTILLVHTVKPKMNTLRLKNISIPLNSHIKNTYKLRARTETIVPMHVLNSEIKEGLLPQVNSIPGLYLSRAITKVLPNNLCLATIANTTDHLLRFLMPESTYISIFLNKVTDVLPEDIPTILFDNHDSLLAGHPGFYRTYSRIKTKYSWKNMYKDVKDYVSKSVSCQKSKINRHPTKIPITIATTSDEPFQGISLDVVGALPLTEDGNKFILTIQDDLTKFLYAVAIPYHTADIVAHEFLKFISLYGTPLTILTDQGSEFMSNTFVNFNKLLKIHKTNSTAYHPETQGSLERAHAVLKEYLRHYVQNDQSTWDKFLPTAVFAYNSNVHSATNYTPYELLFGHKQKKDNKQKSKLNYDTKLNQPIFLPGSLVLLRNESSNLTESKKSQPAFQGPYEKESVNQTNAIIKLGNKRMQVLPGNGSPDHLTQVMPNFTVLRLTHCNKIKTISRRISNDKLKQTLYNDSMLSIHNLTAQFNDNVDKLEDLAKRQILNNNHITSISKIVDLINQLTFLTETVDYQIESILNSILFAKQNVLSPHVMTPHAIIAELSKIVPHLPINRKFPVTLVPQLGHILLDLCTLDVLHSKPNLIFIIHIPLIDFYIYNYYSISPLPIQNPHNYHEYQLIQPRYKSLLITSDRLRYLLVKDDSTCTFVSSNHYLCKSQELQLKPQEDVCEITLFRQTLKQIPISCQRTILKGPLFLWHYIRPNQWIITSTEERYMDITCNDVTKAEHITIIFIWQAEPNCYAYIGSLFLHSKDDIPSNTTIYLPETPIFVDCSEEEEHSQNTKMIHFEYVEPIPLHIRDLNLARHRLEEISNKIDYLELRGHIQRFLPWYSFLSVISLLSVFTSMPCVQIFNNCFSKDVHDGLERSVSYTNVPLEKTAQQAYNPTEQTTPRRSETLKPKPSDDDVEREYDAFIVEDSCNHRNPNDELVFAKKANEEKDSDSDNNVSQEGKKDNLHNELESLEDDQKLSKIKKSLQIKSKPIRKLKWKKDSFNTQLFETMDED